MNPRSLISKIARTLGWHPERCKTFSSLVIGLIRYGNVQHHSLSLGFYGVKATSKALLERIRRFFEDQIIDYDAFAPALVKGIFGNLPKMHLILDRTNWKFGSKDLNYLVLAARIGHITFPLFWKLLDHQGCSDAHSRIELMEMFRRAFGFDKILSFTADREFIGADWIQYLCDHQVPFLSALKIIGSLTGVKQARSLLRSSSII